MSRCRICLKGFRRGKIKHHIVKAHPQYLNSIPAGSLDGDDSNDYGSMANGEDAGDQNNNEDSE